MHGGLRRRLSRGLAGIALASSVVLTSAHARAADEAVPVGESNVEQVSAPSHPSTEGKVLIYSFAGVAALSLAFMSVSLVARESAASQHSELPASGSVTDCTTHQECKDMDDARRDAHAWGTRAAVAGGVLIGAGITTAALAVLWPREGSSRAALMPSSSTAGASLGVQGRF